VDILLVLIPLSLVQVGAIAWFMLWAAKNGQFDDHEGPAHSVILDDDSPRDPAPSTPETPPPRSSSEPDVEHPKTVR
jgi:cbb3-type cytochrome oxidase maturation protein